MCCKQTLESAAAICSHNETVAAREAAPPTEEVLPQLSRMFSSATALPDV
jgi:hypothetical protein